MLMHFNVFLWLHCGVTVADALRTSLNVISMAAFGYIEDKLNVVSKAAL